MIPERMLEFLCLEQVIKYIDKNEIDDFVCGRIENVHIGGNINRKLDFGSILSRRNEILNELTEPYVIDSTSKE